MKRTLLIGRARLDLIKDLGRFPLPEPALSHVEIDAIEGHRVGQLPASFRRLARSRPSQGAVNGDAKLAHHA